MRESRNESSTDSHRFAPAAPEEDYVFGACCPGWHTTIATDDAIEEWVDFMQDNHIERVCVLLTGGQLERTDADTGRYVEAFGAEKVIHAPIPDHHLADAETLGSDILPFLRKAAAANERVVVHCLAGIGRTGHVLAAWLVDAHDYDPVDAIETVQDMGRSPAEAVQSGNARRGELYELLDSFA
jgi:protein-tyrosine phosphatase